MAINCRASRLPATRFALFKIAVDAAHVIDHPSK
jgi:hypothetical protein